MLLISSSVPDIFDITRNKRGLNQMTFDLIKVGDKIEIKNAKSPGEVYPSRVVDIVDKRERVLSIYTPTAAGESLPMKENQNYLLVVFTSHRLIRFHCTFEGYIKEESNFFVAIKLNDEGEKLQRRDFFRFTCMLAMKFTVMDFGDNEIAELMHNAGYAEYHDAIVRDIGGGGIRFITNADLNLEHPIQCTIMLGSSTMVVKGRLLEKQFMPKSNMKFQYRVLFWEIPQHTQEDIVNYIFTEQRRQRQRRATNTV